MDAVLGARSRVRRGSVRHVGSKRSRRKGMLLLHATHRFYGWCLWFVPVVTEHTAEPDVVAIVAELNVAFSGVIS